jgi:flavin-dependent dehydrogenase
MSMRRPLAIYSRQVLNGLLLDRARRAGAAIVRDRVVSAVRQGGRWNLLGRDGQYAADFCVVATGARNPLRDLGTQLTPQDAYVALGYFVPREQEHIEIQFLQGLEGYVWVPPIALGGHLRQDHRGGRNAPRRAAGRVHGEPWHPDTGATFYCHLLRRSAPRLRLQSRSRRGWAAAGDAAGWSTRSRRGLYYALRSATCCPGA